jgi:hypothetical protein
MAAQSKYVRPVVPIVAGLVALAILIYLGALVAAITGGSALGEALSSVTTKALRGETGTLFGGWLFWLIVAGIVLYVIYALFAQAEIWQVGTREVVFMALGAALYGFLSWFFNSIPVPSVSLVSLRPTVAIPVFFGIAFGPVVGFFTGFVGNVLGDALTGWGVFPVWDLGNGLIGLIPGLVLAFKVRRQSLNALLIVSAVCLIIATLLPIINPNITDPFSGQPANFGQWWVVMLAALVLLVVLVYAPRLLPWAVGLLVVGLVIRAVMSWLSEGFSGGVVLMLLWAVAVALLAYYLFTQRQSLAAALADEDTQVIVVWGTLAIILGIGFAALADIWVNGYSFFTAFIGEFIPAAGPNILMSAVLTPLLFAAWQATRLQTGR